MQPRKLIKLGNSSFAIALPKDWIEESGLNKGDEVFVERNANGEIIISPEFKKANSGSRVEINTSNLGEDFLKKEIRAAFIKGYESISFFGDLNKVKKDQIRKNLSELVSFEEVENNEKEIMIKDFFNLEDARIENFVKRIDNNLKEVFNLLMINIEKGSISPKLLKEIDEIDSDINKMHLLISRIFFKGISSPAVISLLKTNSANLVSEWWISFNLESIGDRLKRIIKIFNKEKLGIDIYPRILEALKATKANYEISLKPYYRKDKASAISYLDASKEYRDRTDKLLDNDISTIKILNELKAIENHCYQNVKIALYLIF